MQRRDPQPLQGQEVLTARIPFMPRKTVARVAPVHFDHFTVTGHLRYDLGGADRRDSTVPPDDGLHRTVQARALDAVDEHAERRRT